MLIFYKTEKCKKKGCILNLTLCCRKVLTIIALYSIVLQVGISSDRIAGMAQSVERRIGSAEVTGPIPVSSSFLCQKSLSDNLILFWLFFFLTGNKMINEKIDRMLLCLDDFLECFIFFCQTGDFSFAIHIHLPFYTIQIDTSYMFYVKKYSLKCQDNKDVCGETLLLY